MRRSRSAGAGQAYVEAAIVLPVVVTLLGAITGIGRVARTRVAAQGLAHRIALVPASSAERHVADSIEAVLRAEGWAMTCGAKEGWVACRDTRGDVVERELGSIRQRVHVQWVTAFGWRVTATATRYGLWR